MPEAQNPSDDIQQKIDRLNEQAIGEQPAMLSNLVFSNLIANVNMSQQNAVSNQQAMNQLLIAVTGKVINILSDAGSAEQAAKVKAALSSSSKPAADQK